MSTETLPRLRPLRLSELLDRSIQLYRSNFIKFTGIVAIVYIPIILLGQIAPLLFLGAAAGVMQRPTTPYYGYYGTWSLIQGILTLAITLITAFLTIILTQGVLPAAMACAAADNYLGKATGILDAYRTIGRHWLRVIGAPLLAILLSTALAIPLFLLGLVPCIGPIIILLILLVAGGLLVFFWTAIVPLTAPIAVIERQTIRQAMRRAWDLTRRRFWWVFGFVIVLFIFNQLIVSGPTTLLNIAFVLFQESFLEFVDPLTGTAVQILIQSLTSIILGLIYFPLDTTAKTLLYLDLRIRTEGLDLALQADSATGKEIDVAEILAQAPPAENTSLITWREVGYSTLIAFGLGALYFGLYLLVIGVVTFTVMR